MDDTSAQTEYWFQLLDEGAAGEFLELSVRTLQAFRQRGTGPRYVAVSPRCIRYRRTDLREWAEICADLPRD